MDTHGIAPTPVTSGEELLAKMNLILGAAQQWASDDDDELGVLIFQRLSEVGDDMDTVLGLEPNLDLTPMGEKLMEIKEAIRQRSLGDLQAMYERS